MWPISRHRFKQTMSVFLPSARAPGASLSSRCISAFLLWALKQTQTKNTQPLQFFHPLKASDRGNPKLQTWFLSVAAACWQLSSLPGSESLSSEELELLELLEPLLELPEGDEEELLLLLLIKLRHEELRAGSSEGLTATKHKTEALKSKHPYMSPFLGPSPCLTMDLSVCMCSSSFTYLLGSFLE